VELDAFVVMSNHIHGILFIVDTVGAAHMSLLPAASPLRGPVSVSGSLGAIVGAFKSAVAKRINALRGTSGAPVWQRNDCEHIIRNDRALDPCNPDAVGPDPQAHALWRLLQSDACTPPPILRGEAMPRPTETPDDPEARP